MFRHFVQIQAGEVMPHIEEILNNITNIICDLQPHQYHTFYEAVGLMIQSQNDAIMQEHLIERYMHLPNQSFNRIISSKFPLSSGPWSSKNPSQLFLTKI